MRKIHVPTHLITRRRMIAAGAGLLAAPSGASSALATPAAPADTLAFRVMRHGDEIGRHVLHFERNGTNMTVRIAIDVRVTFASIPIVRYTHRGTEYWQNDMLAGVDGRTDRNGAQQWLSARRDSMGGLAVTGSQTKPYVAPATALPTSYWNHRMLDGPMISMEDGVLLHPHRKDLGIEPVALASGAMIPARRTDLSGDFAAIVWYDAQSNWASLGVTVADGSEIRYQRL
jgi:hypothetical protein